MDDMYNIHKAGRGWYRPNANGYTMDRAQAGLYTLNDALRHTHPNGPKGPRDGLTYVKALEPATITDPIAAARAEGFARGIEAERARAVAWLRQCGTHQMAPYCWRCNLADAIERGDHIGKGE